MNDRPSAQELLAAVERFLREELVPALEGPLRFHALVSANVVGIVGRELSRAEPDLRAEWRRLAELLGRDEPEPADGASLHDAVRAANQALAARIRAGDADTGAWRQAVLDHLKRVVDEKLAVSVAPRA